MSEKKQCKACVPEEFGVDFGSCVLPQGHVGRHLSSFGFSSEADSWEVTKKEDEEESTFSNRTITSEKQIKEMLQEAWEGNVPQEIMDLLVGKEAKSEEEEDDPYN